MVVGANMKYISLFSGIEAFSQAVHDFGWTCAGVSEIDPFACAVLKQRLPNVSNLGDITKITKEKLNEIKESYEGIDLVVGGSPCQSFSVAGLRKGLDDPRGNLMLEYVRVVATVRPSWFVWENVPGALSSGKGSDFGTLIQAMAELGYSLGWRVLDAQHFGVPQRRRRVFLVGSLNKKDGPFKVLFERQSFKGNTEPSGEKRKSNTSKTETSTREHGESGGREKQRNEKVMDLKSISPTTAEYYEHHPNDSRVKGPKVIGSSVTARYGTGGGNVPLVLEKNVSSDHVYWLKTLRTGGECERKISPALTAQTGDTLPTVIEHQSYNITFNDANGTRKDRVNGGCYINQTALSNSITTGGVHDTKIIEHEMEHELCSTLCARDYKGPSNDDFTASSQKLVLEHEKSDLKITNSRVRKLTPMECERLQGFPDDYTRIPYRKKTVENCPHTPRYKALGNSMAVPVMRWLACRIALVEGALVPSFRPVIVKEKNRE